MADFPAKLVKFDREQCCLAVEIGDFYGQIIWPIFGRCLAEMQKNSC